MRWASGRLSTATRLACAGAVGLAALGLSANHAPARVPPSPADQALLTANPALYATARAYFSTDHYEIAPKRLFRLTRDQLDKSAASLLPGYAKRSIKDTMPRDPLQTNYEYAEILNFNAANLAALTAWIGEIATNVRARPTGVIDCPAEMPGKACLEPAARRFVLRAFRGDVGTAKVGKIVGFFLTGVERGGFAQATAELVEVALSSPSFLFRKELDVDGAFRLTPTQRLQAITYTLTDAPPELLGLESTRAEAYFESAESTAATIAKVLSSKAAREKLQRFIRAWLELKEPGEFTVSKQLYPEFTDDLARAMLRETNDLLEVVLNRERPRLKDLTQATTSFISPALETVYRAEVAANDGGSPVKVDTTRRLGIFSQPAVLASHSGPTDTRPIKRGTFWVRKVMCMEMGAVPKGLDISLKDIGPSTERRKIENSTRLPACAGCHQLIDPLGFFQEHYDVIGRWRTEDNGFPIDAGINVDFLDEGPLAAKGPVEALKSLTSSAMLKQCFVRQLYRFYMGRQEEPADDPLLRRMFFRFADKDEQDIMGLLEQLATSERIQRRE